MRRCGVLFIAALACSSVAAQDDTATPQGEEVWIEHFDKASGKPFYYQEVSRSTAWEPPAGAKVKYMDASGKAGGGGGTSGAAASTGGESNAGLVMIAFGLIIGVPFLGLLYCYWMASKEGLADVLKALSAKQRNRSSKRRGTKAGGNFRQRQKTSQDGKGGRSANS